MSVTARNKRLSDMRATSSSRSSTASVLNQCSVAGILGSILLASILLLLLGREGDQQVVVVPSQSVQKDNRSATASSNLILKPDRVMMENREVMYQFPGENCSDIKGILFLYHGCGRSAASFFYSPQGRDMMLMALNAGLAVVAFEKSGACWSRNDLEPSIEMGNGWIKQYLTPYCEEDSSRNINTLPIFGFGASSGGSFVAKVAEKSGSSGFNFSAINVQIMTPHSGITTPTVFTVMSRDGYTMQGVETVSKKLEEKGVPTLVLKTTPKKVTPEYFVTRFQGDEFMTIDIARNICADLKQKGALAEDGELIENPRSLHLDNMFFDRYKTLRAYGINQNLWDILHLSEREDASSLWLIEELNVCYDQHEITVEKFEDVLAFFDNAKKSELSGKVS